MTKKFAQASREKVLDKFSWKNVVDSYEELLMRNKRVD